MRQQQIIAMLMAQQEQALDLFQAKYTSLMRYIVRPILSDPREQEECISDITVKVWQRIGSYDPEKGSFTTWLTVLSRNTALNRARALQPEALALEDAPIPSAPGPEELLLQQEQSQRLHTAIRSLRKQTSRSCTGNTITYSPPPRLPGNWAQQSGPWKAGCTV